MLEAESSSKKGGVKHDYGFTDIVFSWSIEDISNQELYKDQVCINLFLH